MAHFDESLENVMAFGDEENDYEMIEQVGVGVAMGNAIPKIKQVATAETLSNTEDGVAAYLKSYFNLD
jgi:hydroxymethylpyrimidine pyrophosphatase-like HAD family hydrolase